MTLAANLFRILTYLEVISMKMKLAIFAAAMGLLIAVAPVMAHHSFAAEYDAKQPVEIKGKVTQVDWTNPHARFYVDVTDASGKVTSWNFELASPNVLKRNGWTRTSLKIGDEITVQGSRAKDGANMANAKTVVLSDGRKVFAGSAEQGQ
jgi:hypothetical protein